MGHPVAPVAEQTPTLSETVNATASPAKESDALIEHPIIAAKRRAMAEAANGEDYVAAGRLQVELNKLLDLFQEFLEIVNLLLDFLQLDLGVRCFCGWIGVNVIPRVTSSAVTHSNGWACVCRASSFFKLVDVSNEVSCLLHNASTGRLSC